MYHPPFITSRFFGISPHLNELFVFLPLYPFFESPMHSLIKEGTYFKLKNITERYITIFYLKTSDSKHQQLYKTSQPVHNANWLTDSTIRKGFAEIFKQLFQTNWKERNKLCRGLISNHIQYQNWDIKLQIKIKLLQWKILQSNIIFLLKQKHDN